MVWTNEKQPFGANHAPLLAGVSSIDGVTPIPVAVDPTTGAVLTENGGSGTSDVNLIEVGGAAITLGNKTTANSLPVTTPLVPAPLTGQSKIASTGVAVRLNSGTSQSLSNGIIISAPAGNVSPISIGGSSVNNTADGTGNGYLLPSGASISFAVTDTNDIYINGTSGDYVSWAGS